MAQSKKKQAVLVLEDGSVFNGQAFAGSGDVFGEAVFNTGMTGYQEVLTDPSYKGQMLVMTYPLIGNYGINDEDMESSGIYMEGFIVREYQGIPSNWRSKKTLKAFLEEHDKLGVEGIDTRAVTRRIRTQGAMRAALSTDISHVDKLLEQVKAHPGLTGRDLVRTVTSKRPCLWKDGKIIPIKQFPLPVKASKYRIVVVDCGVKWNILRSLEQFNSEIIVVPSDTSAQDILAYNPDGILLSNGPGDPAPLTRIVDTVKKLLGKLPMFGICLGHQILALALGAKTEKLKFGHHGLNQPVKNLQTGRVEITSQNHGFIVIKETLHHDSIVTHINLNDNTLEGLSYPSLKAFSVQYHPEASPGPKDADYLFQDFMSMIDLAKT